MRSPENIDYAAFANQLGEFLLNVATKVGDYIHQHAGTGEDLTAQYKQLDQLTQYGNKCFELAEKIAFTGLAVYLKGIKDATDKINRDLKKLANINKAIAITAAVLGLAVGVLTQNGSAVSDALQTITHL